MAATLELIKPAMPETANREPGLRRLGTLGATPAVSGEKAPKPDPNCPRCCGVGWESVERDGRQYSVRCECLKSSIRRIKLAAIPPIYRHVTLSTVQPDPARHRMQASLFEAMRNEPTASYVLCGLNGCGKTLAGWLLYRAAVERETPAVGLSCSSLVEQYRAWQFDSAKVPAIEPDDLRTEQCRFVFIDEIDKSRPTEFAAEMLFALIDAAYSFNHQLVVTSNTPLEGLAEHWSRNAVTIGPSIVRRLMEIEGGMLVDMF